MMSCAIRADQSGTVNCQHHGQILDGDVMYELVVSALQEG